jgi:hypothetical protein
MTALEKMEQITEKIAQLNEVSKFILLLLGGNFEVSKFILWYTFL